MGKFFSPLRTAPPLTPLGQRADTRAWGLSRVENQKLGDAIIDVLVGLAKV